MRGQPNGNIIDLPDVREQIENLLPNLQPPILREQFKNLLPNPKNREQNREQLAHSPPKSLLPIFKPPQDREQENREQLGQDPDQSQLLPVVGDRQIINGVAYILTHSKSTKPITHTNGWLDVKKSANQRNLYLCLRWREGSKQRSRHLGKVIRADAT